MIEHEGKILFGYRELRCPETGQVELAPGFAEKLKRLRLALGLPMVVNSCCRSAAYNHRIGGHPRSLHVWDHPHWPTHGTCAIDISTHTRDGTLRSGDLRERLKQLAWDQGWSIGLGSTFLHLDRRTDFIAAAYPQHHQAVFSYD